MKVKEIMTTAPEAGRPEDNLARAVELLWKADCGVLPIVDDTGRVLIPNGARLRRAVGCARCHGTGYRGRVGIFEVLEIDDEMRDLVKGRSGKRAYRDVVQKSGFVPLREAGTRRVLAGVTTLEEVLRVT